jgi:hypothetical protein
MTHAVTKVIAVDNLPPFAIKPNVLTLILIKPLPHWWLAVKLVGILGQIFSYFLFKLQDVVYRRLVLL